MIRQIYKAHEPVAGNSGTKYHPGVVYREIFGPAGDVCPEFIFRRYSIRPGAEIPYRTVSQCVSGYVVEGAGIYSYGRYSVELEKQSAFFFPANVPHRIENKGAKALEFVAVYGCEESGPEARIEKPADASEVRACGVVNKFLQRWAMHESTEPWQSVEPSKGMGVKIRYLFDEVRGGCREMSTGIGEISPGFHYTRHSHVQAEIYFITSGRGKVYVDDTSHLMDEGDSLYIGSSIVHGADCIGTEPFSIYYVYGSELIGQEETWTPAETAVIRSGT
ncbi:MAG: cupin domain-containing protein [Rhodospirillaceae bacterium]|nr:cupin domain-containing protein [Rhodospirillaceae bacterium]